MSADTESKSSSTNSTEECAWVQLPDGAKTEVRILRCADAAAPVIMILPALGVPARFYARLATALCEASCNVALHDLRGLGKSDQRAGRHVDFGYETFVLSDLPAVIAHVQKQLPSAPIVFLGHSLGAHLALLHFGWTPNSPVRGAALVACGNPYAKAFPGKQRIRLTIAGYLFPFLARLLGYYPGERVGFGGREARRLITQWSTLAKQGIFDAVSTDGITAEEALSRVERPLLAVTIAGDDFAPPGSMAALLSKVPRAAIDRWHYEPPAGSPDADHFRWAKHSPNIVARVVAFARALAKKRD